MKLKKIITIVAAVILLIAAARIFLAPQEPVYSVSPAQAEVFSAAPVSEEADALFLEDSSPALSITDLAEPEEEPLPEPAVTEDGRYTSKEEVALYIHLYGHLPSNFISKTKARNAGWDSSKGNLAKVCPGMSIGGSRYENYEGLLPEAKGRQWTECDINYVSGSRGAERIVFSNDGLIYYTGDHYKTFEQLY